jgi:hypothetical protein
MSTVTEKRERDEEGDEEGVPEDEYEFLTTV